MTDVHIRPATIDDAESIARVQVETWKVAYRGQVADEILEGLSVEDRARRFRQGWAGEGDAELAEFYIAEVEGEVVGFVSAGSCRDDDVPDGTGEIAAIYVLPEHWDAGVGRALIVRGIETLRKLYHTATLWVLESNVRGRRFYEKGGWKPDGTSQVLERLGGITEVRYRIEL